MPALVMTPDGVRFERASPFDAPEGDAVVRVLLAGICATDLEIMKGYMGYRGVMGHEFVGCVESAPDPSWIGRRVVGDINAGCGAPDCDSCARERGHHCPRRTVLGILGRPGAFADRLALPLRNLVAVPDHVADEAAVFAEPLAAACRILDQVAIDDATRVLVIGAGRLGLLIARTLATRSRRVAIVVRRPARRKYVPADITALEPSDATSGRFDVVVDATGDPEGLVTAGRCVRPGGTIVLKSTTHGTTAIATAPWIIDEVTLVGSRCGRLDAAMDLLAAGTVDPRDLITDTFPLDSGISALARAAHPDHVKVLLRP